MQRHMTIRNGTRQKLNKQQIQPSYKKENKDKYAPHTHFVNRISHNTAHTVDSVFATFIRQKPFSRSGEWNVSPKSWVCFVGASYQVHAIVRPQTCDVAKNLCEKLDIPNSVFYYSLK